MAKLFYTKSEVNDIKQKIYLTKEESQVLDMWLKESTIIETSIKLNISERTVNRRRKSILNKLKRVKWLSLFLWHKIGILLAFFKSY